MFMASRRPLAPTGVIEVLFKGLLSLLYCSAFGSPSFTLFPTGVPVWLLLPRRAR
jgi:hypothetical protein